MAKRNRPPAANPPKLRLADVPNWVTAIAAAAGVLVTAWLGFSELRPEPSPSVLVATAEPTALAASAVPRPTALGSPLAVPGSNAPGAPLADVGGAGGQTGPPDVSIEGFGWEENILLVDGTVSDISGPLWLAVQPTSSQPEDEWQATRMRFEVGDDFAAPRPFEARFSDAVRAERYRIKVFQDGIGFGAGGAPGPSFGDYLEDGGADLPSEILDTVQVAALAQAAIGRSRRAPLRNARSAPHRGSDRSGAGHRADPSV